MSEVRFDAGQARDFLRWGYLGLPGVLSISAIQPGRSAPRSRFFPTTEEGIEAAVAFAEAANTAGESVYFRTTTLSAIPAKGRGGTADTLAIPILWADLDYGTEGHKRGPDQLLPNPPDGAAAHSLIAAAGLPQPSLLIHSGGGLYPIWRLSRPVDLTEAEELSEGVQEALDAVAEARGWHYGTGVGDLARILRLPGSVNVKTANRRACRVIEGGSGELVDPGSVPKKVARKAPKNAPSPSTSGPPRTPFDAFAEAATWADVLEPEGWTYAGHDSTGELWMRPGGSTSSGYSARILDSDPYVLVVFSDAAGLPTGGGRGLTKAKVWARFHHGGDASGAAKDLVAAAWGNGGSDAALSLPPEVLEAIHRATDDLAVFGFDSRDIPQQLDAGQPPPQNGPGQLAPPPLEPVDDATWQAVIDTFAEDPRPRMAERRYRWLRDALITRPGPRLHTFRWHAVRAFIEVVEGHYSAGRAADLLADAAPPEVGDVKSELRVCLAAALAHLEGARR